MKEATPHRAMNKMKNCKECKYYYIEKIKTLNCYSGELTEAYNYVHKCNRYNEILKVCFNDNDTKINKCISCAFDNLEDCDKKDIALLFALIWCFWEK